MKNNKNAFTLVEVVISIALIGAITAASVGLFSGYLSIDKKAKQFNQDTALLFSSLNKNILGEEMLQTIEPININLGNSNFGHYSIILKRKTIRIIDGDDSGVSYYEY